MYFNDISLYKAFLISKENLDLDFFKSYQLNDMYNLNVSKDYQITHVGKNNKSIYLLGYGFDIRDSMKSTEELLRDLLKTKDLYEELEFLNGRFVIIYVDNDNIYISTDAAGLKPVFYSKESKLVSSHEYIIKTLRSKKYKKPNKLNKEYRKGFLDQTNLKNIFKLSSSNELELKDFRTTRIFPSKNKGEETLENIIASMKPYIVEINRWLKVQENKKFSLTGGMDSRISLALSKPLVHTLDFFTYLKPLESIKNKQRLEIYKKDEEIVKKLANNLLLNHFFFKIEKREEDKPYYKKLQKVVSSNHSYELSKYYKDNKNFINALHIKSTVQSIGKTSFDSKLYKENNFSTLLNGAKRWASKELIEGEQGFDMDKSVSDFMERVDLSFNNIYDYHILDLLFLESRLGNFQSTITQETDNTMEIFNYFNTRKFISMLLMPKLEERQEDKLTDAILEEYWPILGYFDINDEPDIKTKYYMFEKSIKERKQHSMSEVSLKTTANLKYKKDIENEQYIVSPNKLPLKTGDEYIINIYNKSDVGKVLKFRSNYNNEKGRGIISLMNDNKDRDVVDLSGKDYIFIHAKEEKQFILKFHKNMSKESWIKAATIVFSI